jgi:hypothetical protein
MGRQEESAGWKGLRRTKGDEEGLMRTKEDEIGLRGTGLGDGKNNRRGVEIVEQG